MKTADLDAVGNDGLDGGKGSAEEGEEKAHSGVGVVADGCHVDSQEQGQQREVGQGAVALAEEEDGDGNGEDRGHGPHDLVERNGDLVAGSSEIVRDKVVGVREKELVDVVIV